MSTFGQIGAMLSRGAGKDRDIEDMPERINNMEGFISKMREWLEPQDDAAILHWIEFADGLSEPSETAEVKVYRGEEEIEYKLGETISEEGEYRVTATDECGNATVYTFTIEAGTNWTLIVLLVVLGLLIAGGLVFFFIRRKRISDPDEA